MFLTNPALTGQIFEDSIEKKVVDKNERSDIGSNLM